MASRDMRWALRELLQGGDITSLPTARELSIDADALMRAAGVRRISDLRPRHVRDVAQLSRLSTDPAGVLAGNPEGAAIGALLKEGLEDGIQLWLCEGDAAALDRLRELFGADQVHIVGKTQDGRMPLAISPPRLAQALAAPEADARRQAWVTRSLQGLDTLRVPPTLVPSLVRLDVPHVPRSRLGRWLRDPAVFFYVIVLVYSALRALPVTFIDQFHGHLGILWAIDMVTAIPYTWGVIAMVTAKRALYRAIGTLVTAVTFVAPYVYFWAYGDDYPWWVVLVVALLVLSGFLIEGWKIYTDRRITHGLAHTGEAPARLARR
ncbi:hypothetical protein HJ590_03415 [Naumannella sp. ID2617S]|nr:hypothetical protein [Naumannella sp. ID2617S]